MQGLMKSILGEYNYPTRHRLFELFAILSYFSFTGVVSFKIWGAMDGFSPFSATWIMLTSVLLAYIAADFVSGFVHWLGDTFGEPDWFFLGPAFIMPFRYHHVDPKDITHHDFIEVNGNSCIVLLLYLIPIYMLIPAQLGGWGFGLCCFSVWFAMFIFLTNQCHKWAHTENPPPFIKRLQNWSLILSPENHNVHHTAPYKTYYCITSGWMNPVIERLHLWRILEAGMSMLTGRDYSGKEHMPEAQVDESGAAS